MGSDLLNRPSQDSVPGPDVTFYTLLNVSDTVTTQEIRAGFRKMALIHHSDKGGDAKIFNKIREAQDNLVDDFPRDMADFLLEVMRECGCRLGSEVWITYNGDDARAAPEWTGVWFDFCEFLKDMSKTERFLTSGAGDET